MLILTDADSGQTQARSPNKETGELSAAQKSYAQHSGSGRKGGCHVCVTVTLACCAR